MINAVADDLMHEEAALLDLGGEMLGPARARHLDRSRRLPGNGRSYGGSVGDGTPGAGPALIARIVSGSPRRNPLHATTVTVRAASRGPLRRARPRNLKNHRHENLPGAAMAMTPTQPTR